MPKLGHIADINPEADYGRRCNPDGSCSGCGECCSDFLPLSKDELKRIKAYAKKNGLKPHWNSVALLTGANDFTCPFRDNQKRRCDIYDIRPEICRSFICTNSFDDAQNDRKLLEKSRNICSVRCEVFGECCNLEVLGYCVQMIANIVAGNSVAKR